MITYTGKFGIFKTATIIPPLVVFLFHNARAKKWLGWLLLH